MKALRKLISILLLAVFGLPLASPAFALGRSAGDGVRACCRRAGMHHCMESMAVASDGAPGPHWNRTPEKCPFAPQAAPVVHYPVAGAMASGASFAAIVSHGGGSAQTQSMRHISRDRSRSKRGPPNVLLA